MKKLTVFLLILFMFSIGPVALAKGNLGVSLNYERRSYQRENNDFFYNGAYYISTYNSFQNGVNLILSGELHLFNNFSLSGKMNLSFFMVEDVYSLWYRGKKQLEGETFTDQYLALDLNLFAKYDLLKNSRIHIGLQMGLMSLKGIYDSRVFILGVGAYSNLIISDNLNLYADLKFPIATFLNFKETYDFTDGFFKLFLYDMNLNLMYKLTSQISVGLDFTISNTNINGIISGIENQSDYNTKLFVFSVGAKVGYKF